MAPKGKAKAKAKAGGTGEVEHIPVPRPPPTPSLVKFPESGPVGDEKALTRCTLLSWRDLEGRYRLQGRGFAGDDNTKEDGWEDITQVEQKTLGARTDVHFVSTVKYARAEFRLVSRQNAELIDGKFVANWFSCASEPVLASVDPPLQPTGSVVLQGDFSSAGVHLRFGVPNQEDVTDAINLDSSLRGGGGDPMDAGPLAGWPGLSICRAQARWRALRRADIADIREESSGGGYRDAMALPGLGEKQTGPIVEVSRSSCPFDSKTGTWSFVMGDVPHGIVARFEVRTGTVYRWSGWSEESNDVELVIAPPKPSSTLGIGKPGFKRSKHDAQNIGVGVVEVAYATDSSAKVRWEPFELANGLTLCEYRVSICQLGAPSEEGHGWTDQTSHVTGIFTHFAKDAKSLVEYEVKGLFADMYYVVKVDARYPYIGDRGWSVPAITYTPVYTAYTALTAASGLRQPPLAPSALPPDDVEQLMQSLGEPAVPFGNNLPWVALLVQGFAVKDYYIEWALDAAGGGSAHEGAGGGAAGEAEQEEQDTTSKEVKESVQSRWTPVVETVVWDMKGVVPSGAAAGAAGEKSWACMIVLLSSQKDWDQDVIICRLRHRQPSSVSPSMANSSDSIPIVPKVAGPTCCSSSLRFSRAQNAFGLMVRFHLATAPPDSGGQDSLSAATSIQRAASILTAQEAATTLAATASGALVKKTQEKSGPLAEGQTPLAQTKRRLVGQRFARQVQVRIRSADPPAEHDDTHKEASKHRQSKARSTAQENRAERAEAEFQWTVLPAAALPKCLPRLGSVSSETTVNVADDAMPAAAGLVWDLGDRHETWLWQGDGLSFGSSYWLEVRVGSAAKWSPWVGTPAPVAFALLPPRPLPAQQRPGREAKLMLSSPTSTSTMLMFPAFVLMPGVAAAEYIVTAVPKFGEAEEEEEDGDGSGEKQKATMVEGAAPVVKTIFAERPQPLRTEDETVQQLALRGLVEDMNNVETLLQAIANERETEFDQFYGNNFPGNSLEVELPGLLPSTSYEVSVTARYPGLEGISGAISVDKLTETMEMPSGQAPPLAPNVVAVSKTAGMSISVSSREVVLELEDRDDYVLQFACLEVFDGWYPQEKSQAQKGPKKGSEEDARWWSHGKANDSSISWLTVPTRRVHIDQAEGNVYVVAELGGFSAGASQARGNSELPDVGRFRLRSALRTGCHPCRWVGGVTDSVATCLAPLAQQPFAKRVFSDTAWHISVAFFVHTSTRPNSISSVAEARKNLDAEDVFDILEVEEGQEKSAKEDSESTRKDKDAEKDEDGEGPDGLDVPLGYGHRKVCWVQPRVRLVSFDSPDEADRIAEQRRKMDKDNADDDGEQSGFNRQVSDDPPLKAEWIELAQIPLAQCKARAPAALRGPAVARAGDFHSLILGGSAATNLQEGGVYQVQLRLGDGHRWSAWSISSKRFRYDVPQPKPPSGAASEQPLQVATLSASSVRMSWPAFLVPAMITEVTYMLRADPVFKSSQRTSQGVSSSISLYTLRVPNKSDKDTSILDATIENLLPATEYTFSVSARLPRIGWRAWGSAMSTDPQKLDDCAADWLGPPAPAALPCNGPRPFALTDEGVPFFHPNERALLLAFPDPKASPDNIVYELEYKHVGCFPGSTAERVDGVDGGPKSDVWPVDFRTSWKKPLDVHMLEVSDQRKAAELAALAATWKTPMLLWRVRLPWAGGDDLDKIKSEALAQLQRLQFRLAVKDRSNCPPTRWFSPPSPPLCAGMAAPLGIGASLQIADNQLGIRTSFLLDRRLAPDTIAGAGIKEVRGAWEAQETKQDPDEYIPSDDGGGNESLRLPKAFCHAFVTHFQIRSRHSPRPPGDAPVEPGRRPPGVPWSEWSENADAGIQAAKVSEEGELLSRFFADLGLPNNSPLDYGSWYQVSARVSDGICWSDWSEPSAPVKVFVAPPKPERPDTDVLVVERGDRGSNVCLRWPLLRAHAGLRLIEHALHVREVLHDRSELCQRQTAALVVGRADGAGIEGDDCQTTKVGTREMMSHVLRDLRQDVTYVFTLSARYPHIGTRDFDDTMHSAPVSLAAAKAPLPVPMQLPLPAERLRRIQAARCVLLQWSLAGLPAEQAERADSADKDDGANVDEEAEKSEREYDLQALPEGAGENEWQLCRNISRMKVDGVLAWLVKEVPGKPLRHRFRLWERASGRIGRTSPLMLCLVEPIQKLGVCRSVSDSSAQIVLRAPLGSQNGSHEFVCRYQVRYRLEKVDSTWTELPVKMLWHAHNDHLSTADAPTDAKGALVSGLGGGSGRHSPAESNDEAGANAVSRSTRYPAIPLPAAGAHGEVRQQRCLVEVLREEDGLEPSQSYVFSVRVGDLYRMADWSTPSAAAKLVIPPPAMDPALQVEDATIRVVEVTEVGLLAEWPQFMPAVQAGVPIHAEVEYLFTVVPQPPKRRLAGRGRPPDEAPQPLSQWLLSSSLPRGTLPDQVGRGKPPSVAVRGLQPNTAYELRLSVRYARLGIRDWTEALTFSATTKKMDAEAKRRAEAERNGNTMPEWQPQASANLQGQSDLDSSRAMDAAMGKPPSGNKMLENVQIFLKGSSAQKNFLGLGGAVPDGSPRIPQSPRSLPPLGAGPEGGYPPGSDLGSGGGGGVGLPATLEELHPDPDGLGVREWVAAMQSDTERVTGGALSTAAAGGCGSLGGGASSRPPVPSRSPDNASFWRRDPSDVRPPMPAMPSSGHPAMQLDLCARVGREITAANASTPRQLNEEPNTTTAAGASGAARRIAPPPPMPGGLPGTRPGRPLEERTAYPRRVMYDSRE
jgi:hypothetical protein